MISIEPFQLLIVAGLNNSGAEHWQTYWQKLFPDSIKVQQGDWDNPKLEDWLKGFEEGLLDCAKPTIVVAHSLAVSLVVHWLSRNSNPKIKGLFLVAPADVDSEIHTPPETRNFSPIPTNPIHIPGIVISSTNDPYISHERAEYLAKCWNFDFVSVGEFGHINTASNLKNWEEGQKVLAKLIQKIAI